MTPKYLLDTNICIYIMKRAPEHVAKRMDQCAIGGVVMSSISYAELQYGVLCAKHPKAAAESLEQLVKAAPVVSFDTDAALAYAPIRMATKDRKSDALDKLIAAHAVALGLVIVTNNLSDFNAYPGVKIENWAATD